VGMGWMLDHFGWGAWGPSMIGFSAMGAVLMLTLWNARPKSHAAPAAQAPASAPADSQQAPRTGTQG
jgi:OPA family glycerol-3-phosphate transporter-like MFS transporter